MKSIIFLLVLLVLSIAAYLNQDAILDGYVEKPVETQVSDIQSKKVSVEENTTDENTSEFNLTNFENSRNLDSDFIKTESSDDQANTELEDLNLPNDDSIKNDQLKRTFELQSFNNDMMSFSYEKIFEISVKNEKGLEILKDGNLVGTIVVDTINEDESVIDYFENSNFDLISESSNQGVYPNDFNQSFSLESFVVRGFLGISNFDYFVLREREKIAIIHLESKYVDDNFEKITISSFNIK